MNCPGIEPKPCDRLEARRPTSRWIGWTLPTASAEQIKTLRNPKMRTEARLKRVARYLLGEPELIWTLPYQDMPRTFVVRTDANWTGQDSEDQKCFSCVVVRCGKHVTDVACTKTRRGFIECTRVRVLCDDFWWSTWCSHQEHLQRFAS